MKLLVINGNGYSIFPPSGAWFFLSKHGTLIALTQSGALRKIAKEKPDLDYLYFDEDELDENTAAELERIWRMDANGDYITVFRNIWNELEEMA